LSEVVWVESHQDLLDVLEENTLVVIDFTAPDRCVPCRRLEPQFTAAAALDPRTKFVAVHVDRNPWAVVEYGVQAVPTVMLYEDGEYKKTLLERTFKKLGNEIHS
jgi:thioredoxin 1